MTEETFDCLVEEIIDETKATLICKGVEYTASSVDRLHNFKQAAKIMNCYPEQALLGFMTKHVVSVYDLVDQLAAGCLIKPGIWREKCGDIRNYLILLEAMIAERESKQEESKQEESLF